VHQLNLISSNQSYLLTLYENILNISHHTLYCGISVSKTKQQPTGNSASKIKTSEHFN